MVEEKEKCIWKEYFQRKDKPASECSLCQGNDYKCGAYLTHEELERREKENELEKIMSAK